MKTTISFNDFYDGFQKIRPNQFSDKALKVLFEYIEQCEEEDGIEMEFSVNDISYDYTEWSNYEEFAKSYPSIAYDKINEHTIFIDVDGTRFITTNF
jgi:hypothetical protein